MRSYLKDKVKSGVEKVKKPLKDREKKKEEKRMSKVLTQSFDQQEEVNDYAESEALKRKKEKAAKIREEAKIRQEQELKRRESVKLTSHNQQEKVSLQDSMQDSFHRGATQKEKSQAFLGDNNRNLRMSMRAEHPMFGEQAESNRDARLSMRAEHPMFGEQSDINRNLRMSMRDEHPMFGVQEEFKLEQKPQSQVYGIKEDLNAENRLNNHQTFRQEEQQIEGKVQSQLMMTQSQKKLQQQIIDANQSQSLCIDDDSSEDLGSEASTVLNTFINKKLSYEPSDPSPLKKSKSEYQQEQINPLGQSLKTFRSSKPLIKVDAPIMEEVKLEQSDISIEESNPKQKQQFAQSVLDQNNFGALEEIKTSGLLRETAKFRPESRRLDMIQEIITPKATESPKAIQKPAVKEEQEAKKSTSVFFQEVQRRNAIIRSSTETMSRKSNKASEIDKKSKQEAENEDEIDKLKHEIQSTQNRLQSLKSVSQQESIIEFSKKTARKSQFIGYSELSELSRTSMVHNLQPNQEKNQLRKSLSVMPTMAPVEEREAVSVQSSSEASYDSEIEINSDELDQPEEEIFIKPIEQMEVPQLEDDRQDIDNFVDDLMDWNEQNSELADLGSDMIVLIDKSESLFITYAKEKLLKNKQLIEARAREQEKKKGQEKFIQQRVLNGPNFKSFGQYEPHLEKLRDKQKPTCVAVSDEVIVFGTCTGTLWAYNRETLKLYGRYENSDREMFEGNPITCIHFHPLRTEYVVVGYQGGQIIMIDLTENDNGKIKSKKVIKDHHRGSPILSVRFCDWIKEREASVVSQAIPETNEKQKQKTQQHSLVEDKQAWMIASVDIDGKIVITTISNVAFGLLSANKFMIVDPVKDALKHPDRKFPRYQTIEPRFFDKIFPQGFYNDSQTWLALGSKEEVQILKVSKESCTSCFGLKRPQFYPSERLQGYATFPETVPVIAWGYGRTPVFKHRTYALMAVAWGPLIQILLLVPDDEKSADGSDFRIDGQYFISPGTVQDAIPETSVVVDVRVESMAFLSESILLVYTSTQDIRVLYTQSFINGQYISPPLEIAVTKPNFDEIESRLKLMDVGSAYTKQQLLIELERRKFLQDPIQKSAYGPKAGQTLATFSDWIVFLTEKGLYQANHLTWQESLEINSEDMQSTWIETFQRVVDIFQGRIKGFRGTLDNREIRQEGMKADLKLLVTALIEKVIVQWKARASKMEQMQTPLEQIHEDLIEKYRTLIKRTIELCVDISEPFFLFKELFQKFVEQRMSELFSEELQPYILGGTFSDIDVPEDILDNHILKYPFQAFEEAKIATNNSPPSGVNPNPARQSPAESFEKILINTNFSLCSNKYIQTMIQFCKDNRMSTGLFYLCISTQGEKGVADALNDLRSLYKTLKEEEVKESAKNQKIYSAEDLTELQHMPANLPARIPLEKSSCYVGYKLLWMIRLLLLGKKFPKGHFEQTAWHDITHEVLDIITSTEYMRTLCGIDAQAFFQIVTIAFNKPSLQHDFLMRGRPIQRSGGPEKMVMSHEEIFNRISNFCQKLDQGSEIRIQYLFFIASIANEMHEIKDSAIFYYDVTQELLKHNRDYLMFNKNLLNRQMTNKQLYRKLSSKGFDAPDKVKHIILSEENIMKLLLKCEPLERSMVDELVEQIKETNFDSLKLILYEKQEDYIQCLKLLLEHESNSSFVTIKMQDRFAWILEKFMMLENRIKDKNENTNNKYQFEQYERAILSNAVNLVKIDAHKTVGLCDALYDGNHLEFLNRMAQHPEERFAYASKLLELQNEQCKEAIQDYAMKETADSKKAGMWQKVLRLHLELACQLAPELVIQVVRNATKQSYYPMEEYLKICEEHKQTEACALLCKKIGLYKEAVNYYIELLSKKLNMRGLVEELQNFDRKIKIQDKKAKLEMLNLEQEAIEKERQRMRDQQIMQSLDVSQFAQLNTNIEQLMGKGPGAQQQQSKFRVIPVEDRYKMALLRKEYNEQTSPNMELIERVLKTITKIFTRQPDEVMRSNNQVWTSIIQYLFLMYHKPELRRKRFARRYITIRIVQIVREMLQFLSLHELLEGTLSFQPKLKFRGIKQLTSEVFWDKRYEYDLTVSARRITEEENKNLEEVMANSRGTGVLFRQIVCNICRGNVLRPPIPRHGEQLPNNKLYSQNNKLIFECPHNSYNHVFHESCLRHAIEEELSKDKKANLKDNDIKKALRCIVCYRKNQDISMALEHAQKKATRATRATQRVTRKSEASGPSADSQSVDNSVDAESVGRSGRVQKDANQQRFDKMGKFMKRFDDELRFDTLELAQFRKHY